MTSSKNSPTHSRRWRRGLISVCALLGVIVGVGGWFWQRSLPDLDGTVTLPGLSAKVQIVRDANGIPSLFGSNRADALRALGYLHASERFFNMEMNRRAGQGRLAEVVGADMLGADKLLRGLELYRLAEQSYTTFTPENQALFEAYAAGVNAWLKLHRDRLPLEFTLLGIKPEPWRPADSVVWGKLMAMQLSANMRDELRRARLLTQFPPEKIEVLYPLYPLTAPVTVAPDFPAKAPLPEKPAPLLPRRGSLDNQPLQRALASLESLVTQNQPGASNEWVVSGSRSVTGKPLLANDPHLDLQAPILWYLVRIVTPTMTVTGGSVPGLPGVLLGQNGHIAWGFTTTNSDVQDVFIETIDPKDPTRYLTPQGSESFVTRVETFKVKGAADVTVTIRRTRHGPVLSDVDAEARQALQSSDKLLALSFTALQDNDKTAQALLQLNVARDWEEFQNALRDFQAPPQNIVYADTAGHIGFTNAGLVPIRVGGDGRYPADGASGAGDWKGMVPFSALPRLLDPPAGTIFNANNAVVGSGAYWFGREWEQPYRAERLQELLQAKPQFSLTDMTAMQADNVSVAARSLLPRLLPLLEPRTPVGKRAQALLQHWDFTMRANQPEPLIFSWWLLGLHKTILLERYGQAAASTDPKALAIARLLDADGGWCVDRCSLEINNAWEDMVAELSSRHGADPMRWRWGDEHKAPFANKVLSHLPGFDWLFDLTHASDGDFYTLNRGGSFGESGSKRPFVKLHGAGYRAVYDLADPTRSRFMIATGQSSHPLSPYYANLLPLWQRGESVTITGTPEELSTKGPLLTLLP